MPAYIYENGAWKGDTLQYRRASSWTSGNDNGFLRENGAWVQFQPNGGTLLPVENLATSGTDTSVTATWTQPTHTIEPDFTEYRIPEIHGEVWLALPDATTLTTVVNSLMPATTYQIQVRNVKLDSLGTVVEQISATKSKFFTTFDILVTGQPGVDPGGNGTTGTYIPFAPNPGGASCVWEWVVQTPDLSVLDAVVWSDTALTGTEATMAAATDVVIDFTSLACGGLARMKVREVCSGVPGDWEYGEAFILPCDWSARCSGSTPGTSWTIDPYTTAVQQVPQLCLEENDSQIECYATQVTYGEGDGFELCAAFEGDYYVSSSVSASSSGSAIIAGRCPDFDDIATTHDCSFGAGIYITEQPPDDLSGGCRILSWGEKITVRIYEEGSGFRVGVVFPKEGSGSFSLQSTTELSLDGWHSFGITIDEDGDKKLYINGVLDVTDSTTTAPAFDDFARDCVVYGGPETFVRRVATWTSTLDADQMASVHDPRDVPYIKSDGSFTKTNATSLEAVTIPITAAAGDLVVVVFDGCPNNAREVTSLGWAQVAGTGGGVFAQSGAFWKMWTGDDSSFDFEADFGGETGDFYAKYWVLSNIDPDEPFLAAPSSLANGGTTILRGGGHPRAHFDIDDEMKASSFNLAIVTESSGDVTINDAGVVDALDADYVNIFNKEQAQDASHTAVSYGVSDIYSTIKAVDETHMAPSALGSTNTRRATIDLALSGATTGWAATLQAPRSTTNKARAHVITHDIVEFSTLSSSAIDLNFDGMPAEQWESVQPGDLILMFGAGGFTIDALGDWTQWDASAPDVGSFVFALEWDGLEDGSTTGLTVSSASSAYFHMVWVRDASSTEAVAFDSWKDFETPTGAASVPANSTMSPTVTDITATAADQLMFQRTFIRPTDNITIDEANNWTENGRFLFTSGGADGTSIVMAQYATSAATYTAAEMAHEDDGLFTIWDITMGALSFSNSLDYQIIGADTYAGEAAGVRRATWTTDGGFVGARAASPANVTSIAIGGGAGGGGQGCFGGGGGGEVATASGAALASTMVQCGRPGQAGEAGVDKGNGTGASTGGRSTWFTAEVSGGEEATSDDAGGDSGGGTAGGTSGHTNMGGGGASDANAGSATPSSTAGGDGGEGSTSSLFDGSTSVTYGSGGGGGGQNVTTPGSGGTGAGSSQASNDGTSATTYGGGGGGTGAFNGDGGDGFKGAVALEWTQA